MSDILETMCRIDEFVLDLYYESMYLDYLCDKMQDEILENMTDVLIELGD